MDENKPAAETRNLVLSVCEMKAHGDVPRPCCASQIVILGIKMYCFGGANETQSFGNLYLFDIARETWTNLTTHGLSRPSPRYGHSMTLHKENFILFGGMEQTPEETRQQEFPSYAPPPCIYRQQNDQSIERLWYHRGAPTDSLYVFNTSTSTWIIPQSQGNGPSPRAFHASVNVIIDMVPYLLIHGGCSSASFDQPLNNAYLLNLESMTWHEVRHQFGDVPSPRYGHKIAYVVEKDCIYLFGGDADSLTDGVLYCGKFSKHLNLEDQSDKSQTMGLEWSIVSTTGTPPMSRSFHAFEVVGQSLYVISGITAAVGFSDFYVFELARNRWAKPLYEHELSLSAPASSILVDKIMILGGCKSASHRSMALTMLEKSLKSSEGTHVPIASKEFVLSRHLYFCSVLQVKNFMSNAQRFKLVTVGDSNVGKSCLLHRFTQDIYNDECAPTIGVDYHSVPTMVAGKLVTLQLWDTAGQERYCGVTGNYYRNADGFVIVFDATSRSSFEHVLNWVEQIKERHDFGNKTLKLIIGNKRDLVDQIVVSDDEGKDLADKLEAIYLGTSAKTGVGVDTAFLLAARSLLELKKTQNTPKEYLTNSVLLSSEEALTSGLGQWLSKCC